MVRKANSGSFKPGDPRAGRPRGRKNNVTLEARELARRIVEDSGYLENLKARIIAGKAPSMEPILWYYAHGKPAETVDLGPRAAEAAATLTDLMRKAANG